MTDYNVSERIDLESELEYMGCIVTSFHRTDLGSLYECGYLEEPEESLTEVEENKLLDYIYDGISDVMIDLIAKAHDEILEKRQEDKEDA